MAENVEAPLAGLIIQMDLTVGQKVEEDEEILVIEALKMETPVYAPCSGTIKEIKVKLNDNVEEDQILIVIDN